MACGHCRSNFPGFIFLLLASAQLWSNKHVEGRISGVKKTIESDGDIIDCIDIYKQPAFRDPLLKKHKIELKHSSYLRELEARNSTDDDLFQSWHKDGECPLGTIPILRSSEFRPRRFNTSSAISNEVIHEEYALVYLPDGNYTGARGSFNVWDTVVADVPEEYTTNRMKVMSGLGRELNAIEVGWQVFTGDNKARSFASWTRDGYKTTGCTNFDCPGFVQFNPNIALGGRIWPISYYGKRQWEVKFTIKKDENESWVLLWGTKPIGYWPKTIFTAMANTATTVSFGGQVFNTKPGGKHTTTQMGSGHFPGEGYGKATYISHIGYLYSGSVFNDAVNLNPFITFPKCYYLSVINSPNLGAHIYYGGPGYSLPDCQ